MNVSTLIPTEIFEKLSSKAKIELTEACKGIVAGPHYSSTYPGVQQYNIVFVDREQFHVLQRAEAEIRNNQEMHRLRNENSELRSLKDSIANIKKHIGNI